MSLYSLQEAFAFFSYFIIPPPFFFVSTQSLGPFLLGTSSAEGVWLVKLPEKLSVHLREHQADC